MIWIQGEQQMPQHLRENLNNFRKLPWQEVTLWDLEALQKEFPEARQEGHPQFMSDVYRVWLLHKYGGLYVDTDCVLERDPKPLLEAVGSFLCRNHEFVCNGVQYFEQPGHPFLECLLDNFKQVEELKWPYTGPPMWSELLCRMPRRCPDLSLIASNSLLGSSWRGPSQYGDNVYFRHLWTGSWVKGKVS